MTDTTTKTATGSVRVEGLRKKYDSAKVTVHEYAVDGVTFDVPQGQFLTLLGPSGCGKTTTLRCIAGLEQPSGGRISMGGAVVYDEKRKRTVSPEDRPIGMVPQSYGIWPHMTVLQNAAFPLRYGRRRKGQRDIDKRAADMLEQVGLSSFADRWATQLSGGQQQRLALARALISEPEVLLLDEPLSNLDAKLRVKLRVELREFQEKFGVTTIYVTHDQAEALAMSDTVILMNGGRIEQVGPPEEIYARPRTAFVADFIGSANLLAVDATQVTADGIVAQTEAGGILCASADQPEAARIGYVCIRPENIHVVEAGTRGVNVLSGTVISAEYLGDRQDFVIDLNGAQVRAAVPASTSARPGGAITVRVLPEYARWLSS